MADCVFTDGLISRVIEPPPSLRIRLPAPYTTTQKIDVNFVFCFYKNNRILTW